MRRMELLQQQQLRNGGLVTCGPWSRGEGCKEAERCRNIHTSRSCTNTQPHPPTHTHTHTHTRARAGGGRGGGFGEDDEDEGAEGPHLSRVPAEAEMEGRDAFVLRVPRWVVGVRASVCTLGGAWAARVHRLARASPALRVWLGCICAAPSRPAVHHLARASPALRVWLGCICAAPSRPAVHHLARALPALLCCICGLGAEGALLIRPCSAAAVLSYRGGDGGQGRALVPRVWPRTRAPSCS